MTVTQTVSRTRAIIAARGGVPKLRAVHAPARGGWTHANHPALQCKVAANARRAQDLLNYASNLMGLPAPSYAGGNWADQMPHLDIVPQYVLRGIRDDSASGPTKLLLDVGEGMKANLKSHAENAGCSATKLATMILTAGIQKMNSGGSVVAPAAVVSLDEDDAPESSGEMLNARISARRTCCRCRESYRIVIEIDDVRPSLSRAIHRDLADLFADEMEDSGWKSGACPSCTVHYGTEIDRQDAAEFRADQEN